MFFFQSIVVEYWSTSNYRPTYNEIFPHDPVFSGKVIESEKRSERVKTVAIYAHLENTDH